MFNWMQKKMSKKRKGFTLVELVVVIAILGLLVALAVPRLFNARDNAAENTHLANVRTIESAHAVYLAQHGTFSETSNSGMITLYNANLLDSATIEVPSGLTLTPNNQTTYEIDEDGVVTPQ